MRTDTPSPDERVPAVSIGVPVYNGEAYLAEALDSLLAQTFTDFEIVVCDNASTDATAAICADYAARDGRIRVHRQPENLGAVPNFNKVFELSRAPLFKWHACDDLVDPSYLEKVMAVIAARPQVVWCHSLSSHVDARGKLFTDPAALDVSYADRGADRPSARFAAVLLSAEGCLDSYGVIRSSALARTPLYRELYGAEKPMMAELALMGPYAEVPETLFYARVAPTGSGNLATEDEQQVFIMGAGAKAPRLARLRYLEAYLDAIRRSAPGATEAWRARVAVMRWLFQVSKWRRIAVRALRGEGVGGRNRERIETMGGDAETGATRGTVT